MTRSMMRKLLRALASFLLISGVYGAMSYFALLYFIGWAMGDGPAFRPYSSELSYLLLLALAGGYLVCQFFGLKAAVRR